MAEIRTEYLQKCIDTLERSYQMLGQAEEGSIDYELYRNSLVKGFELTIEQSGKMLRKVIEPYCASKRAADALTFKDLFRHAHMHGLITAEESERWMVYRDNCNATAHDYGEAFADETLALTESFIKDAKRLKEVIDNASD